MVAKSNITVNNILMDILNKGLNNSSEKAKNMGALDEALINEKSTSEKLIKNLVTSNFLSLITQAILMVLT